MTEIRVLERSKNSLKFEIIGEGHTLSNLLQNVVLEDENVDMAGYTIPHPLVGKPIFYIRTKGEKKPEDVLIEASKKVIERTEEFKEKFLKAIEKFEVEGLRLEEGQG